MIYTGICLNRNIYFDKRSWFYETSSSKITQKVCVATYQQTFETKIKTTRLYYYYFCNV